MCSENGDGLQVSMDGKYIIKELQFLYDSAIIIFDDRAQVKFEEKDEAREMRNLKLISIWRRKKSCGEYVNVHSHKYNELVYYVEGKGKTRLGERDYFFDAGSFALIPPYAAHSECHNVEGCVMCMEVCGALEWAQGLYRDEHGHILRLLKEILAETQNQYYGYKEMLDLKLNELALQLMRNTQTAKQEKNLDVKTVCI